MKPFRTHQLAVAFFRKARKYRAPYYLKSQLLRASSSIALNLAEGSAKSSARERRRIYEIALGSTREVESIVELLDADELRADIDWLARHVNALCRAQGQ